MLVGESPMKQLRAVVYDQGLSQVSGSPKANLVHTQYKESSPIFKTPNNSLTTLLQKLYNTIRYKNDWKQYYTTRKLRRCKAVRLTGRVPNNLSLSRTIDRYRLENRPPALTLTTGLLEGPNKREPIVNLKCLLLQVPTLITLVSYDSCLLRRATLEDGWRESVDRSKSKIIFLPRRESIRSRDVIPKH